MRLTHFDNFRAVAIILIVVGHSFNGWQPDGVVGQVFVQIILGGTSLFVFISGFFFHCVYAERFTNWAFFKNRAARILVPYLMLSPLYMIVFYLLRGEVSFAFFELEVSGINQNITNAILNITTGQTLIGYWYIPFGMLLFSLSGLTKKYIQLAYQAQLIIFLSLFLMTLYVHRPINNINPLHSIIYFYSFYLFGAHMSKYSVLYSERLKGMSWLFAILTVAVAYLMVVLDLGGNTNKASLLVWTGIDLMALQKLMLILFFVGYLQKTDSPFILKPLKLIATLSFGIYFLHPWVLAALSFVGKTDGTATLYSVMVTSTLALVVSALALLVAKKIFGQKSQYLTGY